MPKILFVTKTGMDSRHYFLSLRMLQVGISVLEQRIDKGLSEELNGETRLDTQCPTPALPTALGVTSLL